MGAEAGGDDASRVDRDDPPAAGGSPARKSNRGKMVPSNEAAGTRTRIPESLIEVLSLDAEAEALAADYIRDGAVGMNQRADALHIAIATAARVDVLVSWNFKHIVNLRRIHAFNAVNLK